MSIEALSIVQRAWNYGDLANGRPNEYAQFPCYTNSYFAEVQLPRLKAATLCFNKPVPPGTSGTGSSDVGADLVCVRRIVSEGRWYDPS